MKYFVIVCLVFLSVHNASAQKDFEGVIKYKVITPEGSIDDRDKSDSIQITVFFAPGKMLMKNNKGGAENEEDDVLIIFDSAKIYTLNKTDKTYRVKKLRELAPLANRGNEVIAGHTATPIQLGGNKLAGIFGGNTTLWYADNLTFTVPQKYEVNEELILVNKNHILLKAIINMDFRFVNGMDEENETSDLKPSEMKLFATEIIAAPQSPSLFTIPAEYIKEDRHTFVPPLLYDTTMIMVDSVTALMDTMPMPPPPKKNPSKNSPVKQPVKTTPAKKPIRKEN